MVNGYNEKSSKLWVVLCWAAVSLFSLYLIFSLFQTTVINYDQYARAASETQWQLLPYSAQRGLIYDANGYQLASNTYDYTIVCSPTDVMNSLSVSTEGVVNTTQRDQLISDFSTILGLEVSYLDGVFPTNTDSAVDERAAVAGMDLCRNIDTETQEALEAYCTTNNINGLSYTAVPQRYYNYGEFASQVIGYAVNNGESLNGIYGLESYYNSILSGTDGYRYSEVDASTGGVLPYSEATTVDAVDGNNIVLNIDVNIQRIAEEACREAYETYAPRDGVTAIVMNPYTGAILAMVSLPDYDLNEPYGVPYGMDEFLWNSYSEEQQIEYLMANCWRNRCISDTYEPGSTFKALTTAIALEENLTNENEEFSDEPIAVSSTDTINCWMQTSMGYNHGTESLVQAFENSCNPIFVQLSYRIGVTDYYEYVHTFGFYETTGIDLPAESIGIFHEDPSYVDMACLSFGESATVTPIQLLNSYCAIINGGSLMVPHIVRYVTASDGSIIDEVEPEVIRTLFSDGTCARIRAMMEGVVNDGTGSAGQVPGYSVAGKTSTSTIENGEEAGMHVLSFSCYAPSYNPQIAVLVVLNKPEDKSVGSSAAASTAAQIVEGTLTYMGVERVFTEEEYDEMVIRYYVQQVTGMTAAEASSTIGTNGISTIYGTTDMTADSIVSFTYPSIDATLYNTGIVVLYPDGVTEEEMLTTTVPNLIGKSAMECIEALRDANLNCYIDGEITGVCSAQSVEVGTEQKAGTIITVTLSASGTPVSTPTPTPGDTSGNEDGVAPTTPTATPTQEPTTEPTTEPTETTPEMEEPRDVIVNNSRTRVVNTSE